MSLPACLKCQSKFVYQDRNNLICPECAFEWNPAEKLIEDTVIVKDANGTLLEEGAKVTLIKDLKVTGTSIPVTIQVAKFSK
ncbi:zinc ribbon domain-containing protein YjdM [Psychromonas sp. Urea-02u-13]|uniref:zinc ribbon domain-containing protein YjdM n=1 Tax=Psychromonas sp. Urea-02u-13 TaxID=2058326 RepID=UPI000C32D527|nr:hypothetical protein CXF74_16625 [Psychromonas sp. Urea-02u-13]